MDAGETGRAASVSLCLGQQFSGRAGGPPLWSLPLTPVLLSAVVSASNRAEFKFPADNLIPW